MKTVTMVALKLMTLNTGNSTLLGGLISIIKIENPDIVLLQELSVTSGQTFGGQIWLLC